MKNSKDYMILCLSSVLSILYSCFFFFKILINMDGYENEATRPDGVTIAIAFMLILPVAIAYGWVFLKCYKSILLCSSIGFPLIGLTIFLLEFVIFIAVVGSAGLWVLLIFGILIIACLVIAFIVGAIMDIKRYLMK